ncbi:MAG: hypothetical protein BWY06_00984 [Candidatus Latescibacteria bacterium ADurb.Bin168]|nr:MAG: hypothetical protein BWY06_00984 [Candidatus Latescibacteria bacterium ADurb.Bin168]
MKNAKENTDQMTYRTASWPIGIENTLPAFLRYHTPARKSPATRPEHATHAIAESVRGTHLRIDRIAALHHARTPAARAIDAPVRTAKSFISIRTKPPLFAGVQTSVLMQITVQTRSGQNRPGGARGGMLTAREVFYSVRRHTRRFLCVCNPPFPPANDCRG